MAKRKLSERQELQKQASREMSVFKSDNMIQQGRVTLSIQEQRCVLYAASRVKPTDSTFQEYTFNIKDFYALCGIENDSYTRLKAIMIGLKSKCWFLEMDDGSESAVSWFEVLRTNKKSGKVTVGFHRDMMSYLLHLAEQGGYYTSYSLQYVLPMGSRYSPRLYELLKSYQKNNREWFFDIDELKRRLDCLNYKNFNDFKKRALEPAVKEINQYTDLNVAWDVEKEGRKVTRVIFYMADKSPEALLDAKKAGGEKMDGQITIEEIMAQLPDEEDSVKAKFFRENSPKRHKSPSEGF